MGYPGSGKGYHLWDEENFVDLELPSKTLWGVCNAPEEMIPLTDAIRIYGHFLPTKEQIQELISECLWNFDEKKNGFTVRGKNGNNILIKNIQKCGVDYSKPHCFGYTGLSDKMLKKYIQDSADIYTLIPAVRD